MELTMKKLLDFLQEIAPGEITEKSLCYLLHMRYHTAKRLLSGEITRPDEGTWYKNACEMTERVDKDYEEDRKTILNGRSVKELSKQEREKLRKVEDNFESKLAEKYKKVGIYRLQECCYFPGRSLGLIFDKRLISLVEEVLRITEQFQEITGKEYLLNFLRQNNSSPSDISKIEEMKDIQYHDMANFLVTQVAQNKNKANSKGQAETEDVEDVEDVENVESVAYLLDQHWKRIGTWSFLAFTEEQEKMFQNGSFFEENIPELVFLPGDYTLYVSNISALADDGLTKPLDFQELVDAMFRKLRGFAKRGHGMFVKRLCFNIPDPIYECLYRNLGFDFTVENFLSGHIYVQPLIPFPSSLKTNEPALLFELKQMYDKHFLC